MTSLDTRVRFGHLAALRQQAYAQGPAKGRSGTSETLVALLAALAGGLLALGPVLVLIRRRTAPYSPAPALETALLSGREHEEPLAMIVPGPGAPRPRKLAALTRARLRRTDQLCRLDEARLLVVAPHTDNDTAESLAADLQRHLARATGKPDTVSMEVHEAPREASASELIEAPRSGHVALSHAG